jgi:hypothetical protein
MPVSILISILLFCVTTVYGVLQLVYAWISVPHNQPAIAYGWPLALTAVYIPMLLAAIVAILTLRAGRFFRLTVVSSGVASLLFPVGTVAAIFTLAIARRQFPRWYRRVPRLN